MQDDQQAWTLRSALRVLQDLDHPLWGIVVLPLLLAVVATFNPDSTRVYLLVAAYTFSLIAIYRSQAGKQKVGPLWRPLAVSTAVYVLLFAGIKVAEWRTEPRISAYVEGPVRWEMVQVSTARINDSATSDETFAKLMPKLVVHHATAFKVPASEFRTNIILKNVGTVPIRYANAAIDVYSPTVPVRLEGLTNDAYRFSDREITYDVQRFDPWSDSGQDLYFSISIKPAHGLVLLIVFIHGENMHGVTAVIELNLD
jgi:hypothetical protein